jgi:aminobenzoyl-glutamate transport protein
MKIKQMLVAFTISMVLAELLLVLLSWLLSAMMVGGVRSLLSSEGIRWFFGQFASVLASAQLV